MEGISSQALWRRVSSKMHFLMIFSGMTFLGRIVFSRILPKIYLVISSLEDKEGFPRVSLLRLLLRMVKRLRLLLLL